MWLADVPRETECSTPIWDYLEESKEASHKLDADNEIYLKIDKPRFRDYPKIPKRLVPWLDPKELAESSSIPDLRTEIIDPSYLDNNDDKDSSPTFVKLEDHPEIEKLWEEYFDKYWERWSEENERLKKIYHVYAKLYSIYKKYSRTPELYDLVLGLGYLSWSTPSKYTISTHLIHTKIEFLFHNLSGTLALRYPKTAPQITIDLDSLELTERPPPILVEGLEKSLQEIVDSLWESNSLNEILSKLANSLAPNCQYTKDLISPKKASEKPKLPLAPAVVLKKKSTKCLSHLYQEIIENVNDTGSLPTIINNAVNIFSERKSLRFDIN